MNKIYKKFNELGKMDGDECTPEYLVYAFHNKFDDVVTLSTKDGLPLVSAVASGSKKIGYVLFNRRAQDKSVRTLVLGKGITFDTGGLNFKPSAYISGMHMDMLGAALVTSIGDFGRGIASGVAIAENAVSDTSIKPGKVVGTSKAYPDVRITNTDAEGRLVLADGIMEARRLFPNLERIITIATLTGASASYFGSVQIPVFYTSDVAVASTDDVVVPLKVLPSDVKRITEKNDKNVIHNSSKYRDRGGHEGAAFLARFAGKKIELIHYDIAGMIVDEWGEDLDKKITKSLINSIRSVV